MFTKNIRSWLSILKEGEIFLAKDAYSEYFSDMLEATFYQLLARVCREGTVGKLAKGLYYKPYADDFERLPSIDILLAFFTKNSKKGLLVGERMLEEYGIISNVNGQYEILTNALPIKTKRVFGNVTVREMQVDFKNQAIVYAVYVLEMINIIDSLDYEIDYEKLYSLLKTFAETFDQSQFLKVIQARNYKKRNIAVICDILNKFGISNNLAKFLNTASRYQECLAVKKTLNNFAGE